MRFLLLSLATLLLAGATAASAADAGKASAAAGVARGQKLFTDTRAVTGRAVPVCASCHASATVLREMIVNRGGQVDNPRQLAIWLEAVFDGAQPGARNAKAQYRGVFRPRDLEDLAAYLAGARAI